MTLASTNTKVTYNGDDSTTVFAVTFVFFQNSDLSVILRDVNGAETAWVEGTQYTLTGGAGATGTLTVKTTPTDYTPATGEKLLIKSAIPETQGASLPLGGAFPSTTVEQMIDIVTRLVQQNSEEIARSVVLAETSALSGLTVPEPGAGELWRYNISGTNLETVAIADLSLATITTTLSGEARGDLLEYDAASAAWMNRATDYAPSEQGTPNMTVLVGAGSLFNTVSKALVSNNAQNTATITAPTTNPRNDIVYIDRLTGVVGVETGAEAASPVDPALTAGKLPIARVRLATSTATITDSLIDDIRKLGNAGDSGPEDLQGQTFTAFNDTGAADAYVITPVPAITAYAKYQAWQVDIANANTTASTMNVNGLGTRNIFDYRTGAALTGGEILVGIHWFVDDGTQLILMNPAPPTFTGISGFEFIRKASDETVNNSTTLQDDDELLAALVANETVHFTLIAHISGNITADFHLAFTVPSGATLRWNFITGHAENTAGALTTRTDVTVSGTANAIQGGTTTITVVGFVENGATPGNLQLQWAQNTADVSDTKVLAGSVLNLHRI